MENSPRPLISVVIAMRNEEHYIGKCIDSFLNQTLPKVLFEIIVVDGKSNDDSKNIVKEYQAEFKEPVIRLYENPKEKQAAGWNIGFKVSNAKYVLMMGAHTIVEKDFLFQNIELHNNHDVPCTGGVVIAIGEGNKSKAISLAFNSPFGAGNAKYWYGTKEEFVETLAFGLYKKEVIEKVGYIDERIIRGQDWELNYRITKEYGNFLFSPKIKSYYFARTNYLNLWKRQFEAGFWKIFIIKKHPDSLLLRHLIPMMFSFGLVMSIILYLLFKWALPLYLIIVSYLILNVSFSIIKSLKGKFLNWPKLSWAFMLIHLGYGFGAMVGLINLALGKFNFNKNENNA